MATDAPATLIAGWRAALRQIEPAALTDDTRLLLLRELELFHRSAAALSARVEVAFRASQVTGQIDAGVDPSRAGASVADDLALACLSSPSAASRELTSARALVLEMPHTLAALEAGVIDGRAARQITEATVTLQPEDRAEVDRRLAERLPAASPREIRAAVQGLVYDVDPSGFVRRARKAAADRGVSLRPLPDVMALLSARMPAPEAVAVHAALHRHAVAARASGDPRTLQQLMADELFHRLTGRTVVDGVDVEIGLVMTDAALLDGAPDPAELEGYGPVPAETARELLRPEEGPDTATPAPASGAPEPTECPDGGRCTDARCALTHGPSVGRTPSPDAPEGTTAATVWVRRLLTDPLTGELTARDPRKRLFTAGLRSFLVARDRTCRNSWCGAPVRDVDHVHPHRDGGLTTVDNGRGLCRRCNLARERPRQLEPGESFFRPPPPLLPWLVPQPRAA